MHFSFLVVPSGTALGNVHKQTPCYTCFVNEGFATAYLSVPLFFSKNNEVTRLLIISRDSSALGNLLVNSSRL